MPEYIYQCENKHQATVAHSMLEAPRPVCSVCGGLMHKRPQVLKFRIARDLSPAMEQHIRDVPRMRDEYEEHHGS